MTTPEPTFAAAYLAEVAEIAAAIDHRSIEAMADRLAAVRDEGGRLFVLGAGGGAANASHAVNDFRKLCELESYAPSDNVPELTAWVNDAGWDVAFEQWLLESRVSQRDAVLVLSVGGGSREHGVSMSIVRAVELAAERGATVLAVVGRRDGAAGRLADVCVVVEPVAPERLTPHTEEFQAVVWHLLVSHPRLVRRRGHWEGIEAATAGVAP